VVKNSSWKQNRHSWKAI